MGKLPDKLRAYGTDEPAVQLRSPPQSVRRLIRSPWCGTANAPRVPVAWRLQIQCRGLGRMTPVPGEMSARGRLYSLRHPTRLLPLGRSCPIQTCR